MARGLRRPRRKVKPVRRMNPFSRAIMQEMERAKRPLTTRRIAQRSMITWPTAKKHLLDLQAKHLVVKMPSGNRVFWKKKKKR